MAANRVIGTTTHQRKDVRIEDTVILVSIEDEVHQTLDWSFGGFRIGGYRGSIISNSQFLVNGIGPDLETLFEVRIDCEAIRVHDGQLSASFVELESDVYDLLEALMTRRQTRLDKLKKKLPLKSLADTSPEVIEEDLNRATEACKALSTATLDGKDGKEELLAVLKAVLKLKDQGKKIGYQSVSAIAEGLGGFIEKLENAGKSAGPGEIQAIKVHIESMKLAVAKNIKSADSGEGAEIVAGLEQVRDKLQA